MCEYFLTQYVDNFLKNSIWTTQICTTNICMHQHHVLFVFVIFVLMHDTEKATQRKFDFFSFFFIRRICSDLFVSLWSIKMNISTKYHLYPYRYSWILVGIGIFDFYFMISHVCIQIHKTKSQSACIIE